MNTALQTRAAYSRKPECAIHTLFVGTGHKQGQKTFKRADEPVRCDYANTLDLAFDMITAQAQARPFDCAVFDMRREELGSIHDVARVAAKNAVRRVIVISRERDVEEFRRVNGIDAVLADPIDRLELIENILASATPPREAGSDEFIAIPAAREHVKRENGDVRSQIRKAGEALEGLKATTQATLVDDFGNEQETKRQSGDASSVTPVGTEERIVVPGQDAVTKGFEASISKVREADQHVWQRFVPLANFLYKKLAIVILTALFLTFLAYGAMIVFFMSSSSWSLPFELSRGNVLVEKMARDLSILKVRRNQVGENLASAVVELSSAERDQRDGQLQLTLTQRTIEQELSQRTAQRAELEKNIQRLRAVIRDFNQVNGRNGFAKNLKGAYAKRLITRKALNSGTLAVLETMHRIATVENEISEKRFEIQSVEGNLEFLRSLLQEVETDEILEVSSAGSELSHLYREVIVAKTAIVKATNALESVRQRTASLNDSIQVLNTNITALEKTPIARAMGAPVNVLFVPYTNTDEFAEGQPLYGCALTMFFCSKVGEVGVAVNGETTAVHPLFGKPLRGTFFEAKFDDPKSVTGEIVHAGRAPLWF